MIRFYSEQEFFMKIDIEQAFTYLKNDEHWVRKFLTGSCLCIFPALLQLLADFMPDTGKTPKPEMEYLGLYVAIFLIVGLLGVFCSLFTCGYQAKNINMRIKNKDSLLPDWKFWECFVLGIKATIAVIVYIIALIAVIAGIFYVCKMLIADKIIFVIFTVPGSILVSIAVILIMNLGFASFSTDLKFSSYFNFGRMKKFVKNNVLTFLLYIVLIAGLTVLTSMATGILSITIIGIVAVPFILFYQYMITCDIVAQFVRTAPEFDVIPKTGETE